MRVLLILLAGVAISGPALNAEVYFSPAWDKTPKEGWVLAAISHADAGLVSSGSPKFQFGAAATSAPRRDARMGPRRQAGAVSRRLEAVFDRKWAHFA
jgi:hypothetical protein